MSIQLEPTELTFERPFNREVTQTLHIKNTHFEPVAFKVKTTAPKQYCVRPNSGRIEAGKEVQVQVHLQPMKQDPPADYKCRDKFLVQSVAITADREPINIQHIWALVEKNEKGAIHETKIRVVFLQPGESKLRTGGSSTLKSGSPDRLEDTEARAIEPNSDGEQGAHNAPVGPVSKPESKPVSMYSQSNYDLNQSGEITSTPPAADELSAAKARIAALEEQLKQSQQKLQSAAGSAKDKAGQVAQGTVAMATNPPGGVPVQVCAALCFFVFLLSWYFF